MTSRNDRRRYRGQASSGLLTFLVEPDCPSLEAKGGLLRNAARLWIGLLDRVERFCIVCSARLTDRRDVGLCLIATPATAKPSPLASCCGVCRACADLPVNELERAATVELRQAVPGGEFEPLMLPTLH